jgi:hypothetical protein
MPPRSVGLRRANRFADIPPSASPIAARERRAVQAILEAGDIAFRPRDTLNEAAADRIRNLDEYRRDGFDQRQQRAQCHIAGDLHGVRCQADQFRCLRSDKRVVDEQSDIDLNVATGDPAEILQALLQGGAGLAEETVRA